MTWKRKSNFRPKRYVRSFRDLEVYQRALEAAVMVSKNLDPTLQEMKFALREEMLKCALSIPHLLAEAHSARFDGQDTGLCRLDQAMLRCNKMVVYLEQVRDIYSDEVEKVLCEELIRRYTGNRRKIFHLYKAWERAIERKLQGGTDLPKF